MVLKINATIPATAEILTEPAFQNPLELVRISVAEPQPSLYSRSRSEGATPTDKTINLVNYRIEFKSPIFS